jgi:hypothetical protein
VVLRNWYLITLAVIGISGGLGAYWKWTPSLLAWGALLRDIPYGTQLGAAGKGGSQQLPSRIGDRQCLAANVKQTAGLICLIDIYQIPLTHIRFYETLSRRPPTETNVSSGPHLPNSRIGGERCDIDMTQPRTCWHFVIW